jgi:predicted GNAT family acetyltransferase
VAGVHVYSKEFKVAALGNITTHKDHRGKGLASAVTGTLCRKLVDEGLSVCLSVKAENASAIACYQKLGFTTACEFEEGLFRLK